MTRTSRNSPVVPGASRRTFLCNAGITGGAGAMFATMGALGLAPHPGGKP
ncbi:hypothetical protein GCM10010207_29180 [Streptomyces atratus]|nr:hypothetical protein GCM10010207_29180 [Streptomyces atratus]